MSEPQKNQENNEETGVRGTLLFSRRGTEREDMRLARRAILNGWPVSDELRRLVMERAESMVTDPDYLVANSGMKAVLSADAINVRREAMLQEAELSNRPEVHLHASLDTNAAREVIANEPEYLEFLREKALKECDPQT